MHFSRYFFERQNDDRTIGTVVFFQDAFWELKIKTVKNCPIGVMSNGPNKPCGIILVNIKKIDFAAAFAYRPNTSRYRRGSISGMTCSMSCCPTQIFLFRHTVLRTFSYSQRDWHCWSWFGNTILQYNCQYWIGFYILHVILRNEL